MPDFNASQFLQKQFMAEAKPLEQGYKAERDTVMLSTLSKYKVARPELLPQQVQSALGSELQKVKSRWESKKEQVMGKYRPKLMAMQEVDSMSQSGLLGGDPDMIKARMVLPPEVYSQIKGNKPDDPQKEYGGLESELKSIESRIKQDFEVIAPDTEIAGTSRKTLIRGKEKPGTGVMRQGPEVLVKSGMSIGLDNRGNEIYETRPATREESQRWAMLEARRRDIKRRQQEIGSQMLGASRLQRAVLPKDSGAGTFGQKAVSAAPTPPKPREIRVIQKSTGQTGTIPANEFTEEEYERVQ